MIALSKIRAVSSVSERIKSDVKPTFVSKRPIEVFPILKNMRKLGTHPEFQDACEGRFNREWIFELRPVDWNHLYGIVNTRKPNQSYCKLNKDAVKLDLKNFDPVLVLLLLADFMIFQDVINLHKFGGRFDGFYGGTTTNFVCYIHDEENIDVGL